MSEKIVVSFTWVADELITARKWHLRHLIKPVFRFLFLVILIWTAIDGTRKILAQTEEVLGAVLIFCSFFLLTYPRLAGPWFSRREFAKRPDCGAELSWSISTDALEATSPQGTSTITWKALLKTVFTPEGVLLYTNAQIFNWLPRHGFKNDADFARLEDLARSKTQVLVLPAKLMKNLPATSKVA